MDGWRDSEGKREFMNLQHLFFETRENVIPHHQHFCVRLFFSFSSLGSSEPAGNGSRRRSVAQQKQQEGLTRIKLRSPQMSNFIAKAHFRFFYAESHLALLTSVGRLATLGRMPSFSKPGYVSQTAAAAAAWRIVARWLAGSPR